MGFTFGVNSLGNSHQMSLYVFLGKIAKIWSHLIILCFQAVNLIYSWPAGMPVHGQSLLNKGN